MSIYRFSSPSAISEARFSYAGDRPPVALLAAGVAVNENQLSEVRRAIESAGWKCVPVEVNGQEMLLVDGFKEVGQFTAFLLDRGFVQGDQNITAEPSDHVVCTTQDIIKANSLKVAGVLNLIGDAALLGSGVASGRSQEITAGALYTAGAGVLARYGNVKTEHHVREVSERVGHFLQKQAVELPENCGLSSILKDKRDGVIHNTEKFLYRYPTEVMLSAYTLGAASMLKSGIRQGDPWGIAYGVNSVAVKAASLLIPEKHMSAKEKELAKQHGPMAKLVDWIQEKPLRVIGYGSMISDVLLGLSAMREFKADPKQRSYIFKFITTGTYIMADLMMAISNKKHVNADGKFDAEEQRRIEALAAEAIARQPKTQQQALANQVAGFLATQPEMKGSAADISLAIMVQVVHMERNPWASRDAGNFAVQPGR